MQAKDKFLEKINLLILIFTLCFSNSLYAENIYNEIFNYNNGLKNSSANFIQTNNNYVQEGEIFFGTKRIKITYENPRKLTPREVFRLQGFPESFKFSVSDLQAYRQAGNAVPINVVEKVCCSVLEYLENKQKNFLINKIAS